MRAGLDVPEARRHERPDRKDHGAAEHHEPPGEEAPGRQGERDPDDLEERPAGLRQGVALEQVATGEHVRDRGRLHGERHADHGLRGQQPDDERGGGARVPLGGALAQGEQERQRHRPNQPRRDQVRPPDDATPVESVDQHADERGQQRVGHVQEQDDLEEVVGGGHVLDVEPLLATERDRLPDRALDHSLPRLRQELHAHQGREVAVGELREQPVEEPAEPVEGAQDRHAPEAQQRPRADGDGDHRERLGLGERAAPHAQHCDPGQQRDHDRGAGDQRDAARRISQAEERRGEQPRQHGQHEQAGEDPRLMREVVQGAGGVGEARRGRVRGRARSPDHPGGRLVVAVAGQDVGAGTDLDRVRRRSVERRLLLLGGARRLGDPVAPPRVVLADQEDDWRLLVGRKPTPQLPPVAPRRLPVVLARSGGRDALAEVLDRADVGHLILRVVAGESRPEDVRVRLRPSIRGVGARLVVGVPVVDDQHARSFARALDHLAHGRERRAHALGRPLIALLGPPVHRGIDEDPRERADDDDCTERARDPARSLAAIEPSHGDERSETRERHRSGRRVHEAVVRDLLPQEEREDTRERQHPPDRDLLESAGGLTGPLRHHDRRDDRDRDQRERDDRIHRGDPLDEPTAEELGGVGRRERGVLQELGTARTPDPDDPEREPGDDPEPGGKQQRPVRPERRAEPEPARHEVREPHGDQRHAEQDAGGRVRERRGHPDQEDRDPSSPGGPRRIREGDDQRQQEQDRDVVQVADVRGREEKAGGGEHREQDHERVPSAAERAGTQRETGQDRDAQHQERAEAVVADPRHALQQRAGQRHRHAVSAGEEVVRTPAARDRSRIVLEDHARPPRVPGGIAGGRRQRRIGDETPTEGEEEDEREADDHPPRAEAARGGGRRRDGVLVGLCCAGERHDPPVGRSEAAAAVPEDSSTRSSGTARSGRACGRPTRNRRPSRADRTFARSTALRSPGSRRLRSVRSSSTRDGGDAP